MKKRTNTTPTKLDLWLTDLGKKATAKAQAKAAGVIAAFAAHKFATGLLALICLYVLGWRFMVVLVGLPVVALVLIKNSAFWLWAVEWKKALVAGGRDVPPMKELKATYAAVQKRESALRKLWPDRCVMNGLHVNKRTPLLVNVTPTLDLDFDAHSPRTGFDPDDIKAKAPKLAKGLGCQSIIVRETAPGACDIRFNWSNPLRREYALRDMPVASSDDKGAFGMDAGGEAMSLDLDMSTAYIGGPRSGKSNTQDAWLCDRVDAGEWLNLYVSNPKTQEMQMFKKYLGQQMNRVKVVAYAEGDDPGPHIALIKQFELDMAERNRTMAGKKLTKSSADNPRCILWLDEMLLLPKSVYKDKGDEYSPLRRILSGGPAAMFLVMGGTQLVYSEDFGAVKGLFTQRLGMRLPAPEITDTAFFKGAAAAGVLCHTLHKTRDRGVGWALNDDGEFAQFRSPKVEDADVERALRGLPTPGRSLERVKKEDAKPVEQSVYFIEAQGTDLVKIGIAAKPQDRLGELQTASPHKLAILATMAGGRAEERRLHHRFAASRATGEWFHRTPELDALIVDVQLGNVDGKQPSDPMRHARNARDWVTRNARNITAKRDPEPSNEELAAVAPAAYRAPAYFGTDYHGGHTAAVWGE